MPVALSKKIVGLLLFALAILHPSYGQSLIDSLENKLKSNITDSLKVNTLIELSREYQYSDLKKSLTLAEQAVKISESKELGITRAKAYHILGTYLGVSGDYGSSAKYNDLALSIRMQKKDTAGIARSYNALGEDFRAFGRFDEAYFYYTWSHRFASKAKDSLMMAIALHNIGSVFKSLKQYDKALSYFKITQQLSDEIGDHEGKAYNYDEIGDVYRLQGKYDSAIWALNYSLSVSRGRKFVINELVPATLIKMAQTYLAKGDPKTALTYYDSAYILYQNSDNDYGTALINLGRGKVLATEKKFADAEKLMDSSYKVAMSVRSWTLQIDCASALSGLYEAKGDFSLSLKYYKQFKHLGDSLNNQGMETKMLQDQVRFETAAKEEQIIALTKLEELRKNELKKQELISNILVVVVALVVILLFTVYRSGQRRIRINKLLLEHQEEIKRRSEELEQLNQVKDKFFSIISHDLRSPMNALSAILNMLDNKQIKPEEFEQVTKELKVQFNHTKTLINNLLDWALLQMDKLKIQQEKLDLTNIVEENFKLLKSLNTKATTLVNNIPQGTACVGDLNMVNLVLRNLVLNAIKFTESGGTVEVSVNSGNNNDWIVSVRDNGIGINPDVQKILFEKTSGYSTRGTANEKGTGLGLILCKEFVEKNGGKIWLESEMGKGSTFHFTIKKG